MSATAANPSLTNRLVSAAVCSANPAVKASAESRDELSFRKNEIEIACRRK